MLVKNKNKAYKDNQYMICLLFCLIKIICSNLAINAYKHNMTVNNNEQNLNKFEYDSNLNTEKIQSVVVNEKIGLEKFNSFILKETEKLEIGNFLI